MKDEAQQPDAVSVTDAFTEHLDNPKTSSVSRVEFWDRHSLDCIRSYKEYVDKQVDGYKVRLRQLLQNSQTQQVSPQRVTTDLNNIGRAKSAHPLEHNYDEFKETLKAYTEYQTRQKRLANYIKRREIKERMEGIFQNRFGLEGGYRRFELFVFWLILVVLGILVIEFALEPETGSPLYTNLLIIDTAACAVFLLEYFMRLSCATDWKWYVKNNKVDLVSSIPLIFLLGIPVDGQWLRIVRLGRIVRAARIMAYLWRGMEKFEDVSNTRLMVKSLIYMCAVTVLGGALLVAVENAALSDIQTLQTSEADAVSLMAERIDTKVKEQSSAPAAADDRQYIEEFDKSIWLSLTTVTTGGFADLYKPTTTIGWIIVVLISVAGLVVVGVFTATLASVFRGDHVETVEYELHKELLEIKHSVESLKAGT